MGLLANLLKSKTILKSIDDIPTGELEKIILKRYKKNAPLEQIGKLEDSYAKRVTPEERLKYTDMEPEPSEGVSIDEQLAAAFSKISRPLRLGGMEKSDALANMRDAVWTAGGTKNLTDRNLLAAAEDAYNYKMKLRRGR